VDAKQPNGGMPVCSSGQRLGGFELLARLGQGSMGVVFKARQVSMDRLVALKVLPKKLAHNEQFVARFLREARSAARLRHPNIVQAHDAGCIGGVYYFAMEYVDGETLEALLRREGPLPPSRALAILKQTCSALAAAHDAGVIHRDIKPSNIMLDSKGQVRVTDFGLAKRVEGDLTVTADGLSQWTAVWAAEHVRKREEGIVLCGPNAWPFLWRKEPFRGDFAAEFHFSYLPGGEALNFHAILRIGEIIGGKQEAFHGWAVVFPKGDGITRLEWHDERGKTHVLASAPYFAPVAGRPYVLRLEKQGQGLRVFSNGGFLLEAKAPGPPLADASFRPGILQGYAGSLVRRVAAWRLP